MKYLIQLEDRKNGRKALVTCPANMLLEELSVKIKVELRLPLADYNNHCFLLLGKVYVPDVWAILGLWGEYGDYEPYDAASYIQYLKNYPSGSAIRYSDRYRLRQVFTGIGSVITYDQYGDRIWSHVTCTLVKRLE